MRHVGRRVPMLLVLTLLGLGAIIGWEVIARDSQQTGPTRLATVPPRAGPTAVTEPTNQREAWFKEVLARPLFSPDRRPIEATARTVRGLPRLAGIIVSGSRRVAIFAAASGGAPIVAEAGSRVGAYSVRAVSDTGVTVVGPEGTTVVRPIFDPNPKLVVKPPGIGPPVRPAR